jgi:hypothetical protein
MRVERVKNFIILTNRMSLFSPQIVSDTIGEEDPQKPRPTGIFTDIPC